MFHRRPVEGIPAGITAHDQPVIPNEVGLSGLVLYLNAGLGITVTGLGVSTWADQSGGGLDFTQGTDANRPASTTDSGTPSVFFDTGGFHWVSRGFTAALNTEDVTFVAFQRIIDYAALRPIAICRNTGQYTWTQNSTNELVTRTSGISAATAQVTNRTMRVLTISDADVANTYKNSTVTLVQTGSVGISPAAGTHLIGVNSDVSATAYMHLYELIQYNRVLTNDELLALGAYGVRRFGIT